MLIGKHIRTACDPLQSITVKDLYSSISNPDAELASKVSSLRIIKELDGKQYQSVKAELPYVVCGTFYPNFRKGENFASIDSFIVDIDNVSAGGFDITELRKKVESDDRVSLSFISPGEDGLKLLFHLSEKCFDKKEFSLFYKSFARSFSAQYGLDDVVDFKTCDVTRACFLSVDPDAFYRENPTPVDYRSFVQNTGCGLEFNDDLPFDMGSGLADKAIGPSDDDIERIRQVLFKKRQQTQESNDVFVPGILETLIPGLTVELADNGVALEDVRNIQYGKKLSMVCAGKAAEVNVFYGRRGFTVVPTPKRGTDRELNNLLAEMIEFHLKEHYPDA